MSCLIGVTMRIIQNQTYYEVRDGISSDYIEFFNQYNITPILIPNNLIDPVEYFKNLNCKALILTGGEDILITKNNIESNNMFKNKRDETEYRLLDYCIKNDIPVLGICRGMQMINIYFGGQILDLNKRLEEAKHVNTMHRIKILDKMLCLNLKQLEVNSYHNNGVVIETLSSKLDYFAITEENVIEGLYYKSYKTIGIQWHPERSKALCDDFIMKKWLSYVEEK
ncbi:gamma-glutamyl-gamma-aminobutyrate hydrolase family protein [uncultured Clostridium sp.]|uniref:gamma-glutamyl-gamma-aminobutyrate hydrolase family protein n=1 Tax=uncultured Clostridium sp. TaxID=59620 RepID=UPI0028EF115A|nr:gamma-glutamyl-gamma-aminobutyrate hydrolase family protein [uncultured Clostridium sp.]